MAAPQSPARSEALSLRCTSAGGVEVVPLEGTVSFDKGFFLVFKAIAALKEARGGDSPVLVGLAGPSGAGKTVFAEKLLGMLPGSALLAMDMYNDGSRVVDGNYDDPRLTDLELLQANLTALRAGQAAEVPIYDFRSSTRVGYRTVAPPGSRVLLVEGTFALSDALRPLLDLRVAITGGVHRDLLKRVLRDVTRSGQAPAEIVAQVADTVYPMYKAFIEPDLQTAHLSICNTFNPFAGFATPTYILKSDAAAAGLDEAAVRAALGPGCVSVAESGTVDIYLLPPHCDAATCATWLRMRNRDGRYLLVFEEFVTDGAFIISPNVRFEVTVRILGGLMALGYTVGALLKRSSSVLSDAQGLVTVKLDTLEGFSHPFVQVQGKLRAAVEETARKLGLQEAACIPSSYIQLIQSRAAARAPSPPPAGGDGAAAAAAAPGGWGAGGGQTEAPPSPDGPNAFQSPFAALPLRPGSPPARPFAEETQTAHASRHASPAGLPQQRRLAALATRLERVMDGVGGDDGTVKEVAALTAAHAALAARVEALRRELERRPDGVGLLAAAGGGMLLGWAVAARLRWR